MAHLAHHEDSQISIYVEGPFDDPYELSQTLATAPDGGYYHESVDQFEPEGHLSPLEAMNSPLTDDYFPSSPGSAYSFASDNGSPLYSPHSHTIPSPFSSTSELEEGFPNATVSPQDIMGGSVFWVTSTANEQHECSNIEPLNFEDHQSQSLVAIDRLDSEPVLTSSTLFSEESATQLRITIPTVSASRPTTPISPFPASPASLSVPSPYKERSLSPAASDSQDSDYASPLSGSLSPLPEYESTRSRRRGSTASDSSLRVRSSPKRGSPRQRPYTRPGVDPTYVIAAEAASMTLEGYMHVVDALKAKESFKGHDWSKGLPVVTKQIIGSPQTRRASGERRTDSAAFDCPVPGCGANLTKKHNLMYHLQSHFAIGAAFVCERCNKSISHSSSLERHRRAHDVADAKAAKADSSANSNRKKRAKKY